MHFSAVIDLGFGDSGKGLVVDYLAAQATENKKNTLVVRFSGGHQAGHTVFQGSFKHVFSNFCAGTLRSAHSYYSEHCVIFPSAILAEHRALSRFAPVLYVHPLALVTTPYDIAYNRITEKINRHGSCGVGVTATYRRSQLAPVYAHDLAHLWILKNKMNSVQHYYRELLQKQPTWLELWENEIKDFDINVFINHCADVLQVIKINRLVNILHQYDSVIFEGSQGVLLDARHGIYPHVTYSNTTSKNIWEVLQPIEVPSKVDMYYVTRAYQTRHGAGPMSELAVPELIENKLETNVENEYQGQLRKAGLDTGLLNYALQTDQIYHPRKIDIHFNLVITCTDQVVNFNIDDILNGVQLAPHKVYISDGPAAENMKVYKTV